MPDKDNNKKSIPEHVADALDTIEEFTPINVPKVTAHKAGAAYIAQQAAAITLALPLAVGGPATISQEPIRRPDENLPTQHRGNAEPMRSLFVAASTTGSSVSLSGLGMRADQGTIYYVVPGVIIEQASEVSKSGQTPQENRHNEDPTD